MKIVFNALIRILVSMQMRIYTNRLVALIEKDQTFALSVFFIQLFRKKTNANAELMLSKVFDNQRL